MRIENGIPRPSRPGSDLAQQVRDLARKVKQLEARRTWVAVDRIVEGGTINPAVGTQLTEVVQEQIVIEGGNLAPDALDNKALFGSSVTAVGEYTAGDLVHPDNEYNPKRQVQTRAVLDSRQDSQGPMIGQSQWPGLYLESIDPVVQSVAPYQPARVVGGTDGGARLMSEQATPTSPRGEVLASPWETFLRATGQPHPVNKLPGVSSTVRVGATTFRLESSGQTDIVGKNTASVYHDGDGILRLDAGNGVLVNGAPIGTGGGSGSDSGWRTASYLNGWMDYGNGFGGLQYRKLNGVLFLRGTIKGGAFYTTASRLPEGFRPVVPAGTTAMEFPIAVISGSSYIAGSMFAYANGDLTYYAPPSSWAGADRVIINAAFPL